MSSSREPRVKAKGLIRLRGLRDSQVDVEVVSALTSAPSGSFGSFAVDSSESQSSSAADMFVAAMHQQRRDTKLEESEKNEPGAETKPTDTGSLGSDLISSPKLRIVQTRSPKANQIVSAGKSPGHHRDDEQSDQPERPTGSAMSSEPSTPHSVSQESASSSIWARPSTSVADSDRESILTEARPSSPSVATAESQPPKNVKSPSGSPDQPTKSHVESTNSEKPMDTATSSVAAAKCRTNDRRSSTGKRRNKQRSTSSTSDKNDRIQHRME
eukprot:785232_1